jgi:3-carboxy-cis,cis-muconate cycloisomerase
MISLLDSEVFGDLFGVDERIATAFVDDRRVRDLIDVEVALARAEASVGVIPASAAEAIAAAAATLHIDVAALRQSVASSGVPTIDLVRQLRLAVGPEMAGFVHRGATSQDIVDTAAVLGLRRQTKLIEERLKEAVSELIGLADRHRSTIMAGRTHGQQASPITFGLKAANWLAPLTRHWQRLSELKPRLFVVQFGGAAGTLAALGSRGPAVLSALARELDLGPAVPWHTQRDAIVEYGNWLALVAGSLGKIGQDVILLAQTEVAEVLESSDGSRGGSSTMPHKANPIGSEMMVVAARATGALLSALHASAIQEHERSTHGWPLEWLVLPQMVALTYGSARRAALLARDLQVDIPRMRENVHQAGDVGLAESLSLALAQQIALEEAQTLVKRAAIEARASRESLVVAVRRAADARGLAAGIDWDRLGDPSAYLGATHELVDRILDEARRTVR